MGKSRTVLHLDLRRKATEIKVYADTFEYIGGLGLALKLMSTMKEQNPVIFSVGPLNNSFPFASKACCLFYDAKGQLVENYIGGALGLTLSLTTYDALVISGRSPEPTVLSLSESKVEMIGFGKTEISSLSLPGHSSCVIFSQGAALADDYFEVDPRLGARFWGGNLRALITNAYRSQKIEKPEEHTRLYHEILSRGRDLTVSYSNFPSCAGCPAGCAQSWQSSSDLSLTLPYCLVACGFAAKIFTSVPMVFSCLSSLGLGYSHEILEDISVKINQMRDIYAHV